MGPTGSAINPGTGVFTWTPLAPGNYPVTVRVTDNGVPALSATTSFTIIAAQSTAPRLALTRQGQVLSVSWPESPNYTSPAKHEPRDSSRAELGELYGKPCNQQRYGFRKHPAQYQPILPAV